MYATIILDCMCGVTSRTYAFLQASGGHPGDGPGGRLGGHGADKLGELWEAEDAAHRGS